MQTYKYVFKFEVPVCKTGHVALNGTYAADNDAQAFLDGQHIAGSSCGVGYCYNAPKAPIPLNVGVIAPGQHTLRIDVVNTGGISGLLVNAQLKQMCPEKKPR